MSSDLHRCCVHSDRLDLADTADTVTSSLCSVGGAKLAARAQPCSLRLCRDVVSARSQKHMTTKINITFCFSEHSIVRPSAACGGWFTTSSATTCASVERARAIVVISDVGCSQRVCCYRCICSVLVLSKVDTWQYLAHADHTPTCRSVIFA